VPKGTPLWKVFFLVNGMQLIPTRACMALFYVIRVQCVLGKLAGLSEISSLSASSLAAADANSPSPSSPSPTATDPNPPSRPSSPPVFHVSDETANVNITRMPYEDALAALSLEDGKLKVCAPFFCDSFEVMLGSLMTMGLTDSELSAESHPLTPYWACLRVSHGNTPDGYNAGIMRVDSLFRDLTFDDSVTVVERFIFRDSECQICHVCLLFPYFLPFCSFIWIEFDLDVEMARTGTDAQWTVV
jgi:hypothetical protein